MKIAIDLQSCQTDGSRKRGIGRYSLNIIKTLINKFPDNEYILFANSSLYNLRDEFSNELLKYRFNVHYMTN